MAQHEFLVLDFSIALPGLTRTTNAVLTSNRQPEQQHGFERKIRPHLQSQNVAIH